MSLSPGEFRRIAMDNRFELLRSLAFFYRKQGVGAAGVAERITQEAIKREFIGDRKPIPGATFDSWIRDKKAPAWAIKAALFMVMDLPEFSPSENEKMSIVLTLAELHPKASADELQALLEGSLKRLEWAELLEAACLARKRGMSNAK